MRSSSTHSKCEKLRVEHSELRTTHSKCEGRLDKLVAATAKEKIDLEKKLNRMGLEIDKVKIDLIDRGEQIAELGRQGARRAEIKARSRLLLQGTRSPTPLRRNARKASTTPRIRPSFYFRTLTLS